jgi:glycerol uptake facilitator-like aquaporin
MTLCRQLVAEFLGTALLLVAVVGSGIMAERLAEGNLAVALLANALATGAALVVLITVLGPLSGAHFNPCVSLYAALRGEMTWRAAGLYIPVQFIAAVCGVWLTHAMFALPLLQTSTHLRDGPAQWLAETIATFGLLLTIAGAARFKPDGIPLLVGLYITGAYWFTASTSFANPAVTVARMLTDSFSGIAPGSAPGFIAAQLIATVAALRLLPWLFGRSDRKPGMDAEHP